MAGNARPLAKTLVVDGRMNLMVPLYRSPLGRLVSACRIGSLRVTPQPPFG